MSAGAEITGTKYGVAFFRVPVECNSNEHSPTYLQRSRKGKATKRVVFSSEDRAAYENLLTGEKRYFEGKEINKIPSLKHVRTERARSGKPTTVTLSFVYKPK